jgi:signal peptidase II
MNKAILTIIGVIIVLDRLTKYLIAKSIPLEAGNDVIPGCFRLVHLENPGSAFSFLAESTSPWRGPALIAISLVALIVIAALLWKDRRTSRKTVALALILGGALGNLWDRLADGTVTDFLDFYIGSHHWPAFNMADSAIVTGALLLLTRMLWPPSEELPNQAG